MSLLWKTATEIARATYRAADGEHPIPDTHLHRVVPMRDVKRGDFFRHHLPGAPYKMAQTDAYDDPTNPWATESSRMLTTLTDFGEAPHTPEATEVSVYRHKDQP